jgi:hypothetical protein
MPIQTGRQAKSLCTVYWRKLTIPECWQVALFFERTRLGCPSGSVCTQSSRISSKRLQRPGACWSVSLDAANKLLLTLNMISFERGPQGERGSGLEASKTNFDRVLAFVWKTRSKLILGASRA